MSDREVSQGVPRVSCRQANVRHIQPRCPQGVSGQAIDGQEKEHAVKMNKTVYCIVLH